MFPAYLSEGIRWFSRAQLQGKMIWALLATLRQLGVHGKVSLHVPSDLSKAHLWSALFSLSASAPVNIKKNAGMSVMGWKFSCFTRWLEDKCSSDFRKHWFLFFLGRGSKWRELFPERRERNGSREVGILFLFQFLGRLPSLRLLSHALREWLLPYHFSCYNLLVFSGAS